MENNWYTLENIFQTAGSLELLHSQNPNILEEAIPQFMNSFKNKLYGEGKNKIINYSYISLYKNITNIEHEYNNKAVYIVVKFVFSGV